MLKQPLYWVIIRQLSKLLGFCLTLSPLKKEVCHNLQLIYRINDPQQLKTLTVQYLYKMSRYIIEVLNLGKLTTAQIDHLVNFQGLNILDNALSKNKGIIMLCMHAGNWELLGCSLAQKNYPLHAVVNSPDNNKFLNFLDKNRLKNKVQLININKENMYRSSLSVLRKNEIILIAADTGATDSDKNIELEFLGRKLPIASGWGTIALRTGALIIPVFCSTAGNSAHNFEIAACLNSKDFQNEKDLLSTALKYYSEFIDKHPTEWFLALSSSEVKKTFKS